MNLSAMNLSKHVLDLNSTLSNFIPLGNAKVVVVVVMVDEEHELRHDNNNTWLQDTMAATSNPSPAAFIYGNGRVLW